MIYSQMFKKYRIQDQVAVGIIGTGAYGTAIVTQGMVTPYLKIMAIADINLDNAIDAYHKAGIQDSDIRYCATTEEADVAISDGKYVYTDQSDILACIPKLDIICDSTGNPEVTARNILHAITHKKHVAVITKDCDACVGPLLKKKADEQGVVYTPVDGDQHGLLIQMYEWAKSIGLKVLCGGKSTDGEFVYNPVSGTVTIETDKKISPPYQKEVTITEDEKKFFQKIPSGKAKEYIDMRQKALNHLPHPGAYDLCEMTIAANYTGLSPQIDTLFHAPMRITEIPEVYCQQSHNGLLESDEILDLVTVLRTPDESGLGGGVFLVVRCDNAYSNYILSTKGQIANTDESATVIYRPYHLCGVETPCTLLVAGLLGLNTASDHYIPRYQIAKVAETDMHAGDVFGGDHDSSLSARILPYKPISPSNYAEGHMLCGNRAKVDIPKGTLITYDMVEEPEDSLLWKLRKEQDSAFGFIK